MNNGLVISNVANKPKTYEFIYSFLACALPIIGCLFWLMKNSQFPATDATEYVTLSHKIYQHYADNGVFSGLFHTYSVRGWRGIFFQVLTVPFLLLSHGNVLFSYKTATLAFISMGAIYLYYYLRLFIEPFAAMTIASLICILPFVLNPAFSFMAEIAIFPFIIGSLYHLLQSNWLTDKRHNVGLFICMTLAVLCRPVEAVTDLLPILAVYIGQGIYRGTFTIKELSVIVTMGLAAIYLFLFCVMMTVTHQIFFLFHSITDSTELAHFAHRLFQLISLLLVISLVTNVVLFRKPATNESDYFRNIFKRPLVKLIGSVCFVATLWFAPYAALTYSWIYFTSIGDIANTVNLLRQKLPISTVLYGFITEESTIAVLSMFGIFLLGLLTVPRNKIIQLIKKPAFYLPFLMLPFPLWEVLNTCQIEPRKLSLVVSLAFALLLCIGLQRGKFWRTRVFLVLSILTFQFTVLFNTSNALFPALSTLKFAGNYTQPITIQPNPHDIVLDFLDTMSKQHNLKKIFIGESYKFYMPFSPYLLQMMTEVFNHPYQILWTGYPVYLEHHLTTLTSNNDAVFVVNSADKMDVTTKLGAEYKDLFINETSNPDVKIYYGFLYHYAANKLKDIGLQQGPCIQFKAGDANLYKGCILISSNTTGK